MLKVLIVEDDLLIADMMEECLLANGFVVCGIATNIADSMTLAAKVRPDVAVVDVRLENGDLGTELGPKLKHLGPIGILYATGNIDLVIGVAVGEGCLKKPYNLDILCSSVRYVDHLMGLREAIPDGLTIL